MRCRSALRCKAERHRGKRPSKLWRRVRRCRPRRHQRRASTPLVLKVTSSAIRDFVLLMKFSMFHINIFYVRNAKVFLLEVNENLKMIKFFRWKNLNNF
jgi:hypothetical protein